MREIIWKLADRTLVFADGRGFVEMALPGEGPAGALRWVARILTTTGLLDSIWWLPYLALGMALGVALHLLVHGARRWKRLGAWMAGGVAYGLLPAVVAGHAVWSVTEPSYPLMNLLGTLAGCGVCALGRAVCRRRGRSIATGMLGALLFVPLGGYALVGAAAAIAREGVLGRKRPSARRACGIGLALVLAALPLACRFVYDDLSWAYACEKAFAAPPCPQLDEGVASTLRLERFAKAGDWSGILADAEAARAEGRDFPLRMEIAYRILAQYRTGRLPEELFRHPIRTDHATTDARQLSLDGYLLLYHYGFLLPARRQIFERANESGWEPSHFRYLGDISVIRREKSLAYRDYAQLARCPFHGDEARRRLAELNRTDATAFADLRFIAADARVWSAWWAKRDWKFFRLGERVEDFVYNMFLDLKEAPENMARMYLAAALLCHRPDLLTENVPMLDRMCPPPAPWPTPVQEAFPKPAREGAVSARTAARRAAWDVAWRRIAGTATPEQKDDLRARFGDTWWFYHWWVR